MARLSSDGKYVTVEAGDTLSQIAEDYAGGYSKYKQLAAINNISNPDLIYVGQIIYLTSSGSGGGDDSNKTPANTNKATIKQFGLLSNVEDTLFATWSWTKGKTESYKVLWTFDTGNGVWLVGSNSTITVDADAPSFSKQSIFSIPDGARKVRFKVKPISKKKTQNDKETSYWTAEWSTVKTYTDSTPLETPDTPSVTIEKYKLTATLDNIDFVAEGIEFEIVKDNAKTFKTGKAKIVTGHASYSCTVDAGSEYKVRCRAYKGSDRSDWSGYSANEGTIPATPTGITKIRANDETSVYLEWAAEKTAKTYNIEYTEKKEYFDGSDKTTTKTGIEFTHFIVSGLESGREYFFRVKAVNEDGESGWSKIKSVVVGKDPAAPTTWSSTTTAIAGEELNLYWIHNSEDGSVQTFADLELYINGFKETYTLGDSKIDNSTLVYEPLSEEDKEDGKTNSVSIKTATFSEGIKIEWRVRTAGITKVYGDWSIQRTIDIYAPPTLALTLTDADANPLEIVTAFPFYITGVAGPKTQVPIGYHLTITANERYEITDYVGNTRTVAPGEEVYSQYFDTFEALLVEFRANDIDLENNVVYTVTCTVSMDSGLTAESSLYFAVAWTDMEYEPNAEISIDEDTLTAYIRPYCEDTTITKCKVKVAEGVYTVTSEEVASAWGEVVAGVVTTTGERVYFGVDENDEELYFAEVESKTPITNVLLSVYRREFDGSFTALATALDGARSTTITDPHPSLDLARYRIVAISKDTGSVSYYDLPGYPVGGTAAVIQWDEAWSSFDVTEEAAMEQPPWAGSLLKLPYNIDVSDNNKPDVALVEYIGREHPVGYYGTQLGHTSNWNTDIPKTDKETLYALRRLQRWMGDVYVREPSGSGYWANVTVSFSQKHKDLVIPVTLSITRVEGGVYYAELDSLHDSNVRVLRG